MRLACQFLLIFFAVSAMSCQTEKSEQTIGTDILDLPTGEAQKEGGPEITFDEPIFETGRITQGEVVKTSFAFTNTGDAPLVIAGVTGSCGCTIPKSYPRDKIMPGEGGVIDVEFNSDNKWGKQDIVIAVTTNTLPSRSELLIRTDIVVPDNMKTN